MVCEAVSPASAGDRRTAGRLVIWVPGSSQGRAARRGCAASRSGAVPCIEQRLQSALHGRRLIGIQEVGDRHAPHQAEMRLAGHQRTKPEVVLHDKFLLILRLLLQGPLIAFIALVGTAPEDQGLHAILRRWYDRARFIWALE